MTKRINKVAQAAGIVAAMCFSAGGLAAEDSEGTGANLTVPEMTSPPLDPNAPLSRVAFGSCFNQNKEQEIWRAVRAAEPDAFLFMGDNMYADKFSEAGERLTSPALIAEAYGELARSEPFAELRRDTPVLATWDDHDYGLNDAGADYIYKKQSERLFLDAWGATQSDPRRGRDGVYTSGVYGPEGRRVQIILLDTRYFRSPFKPTDEPKAPGKEIYLPDDDPQKTILGKAQWAWLETELKKPADVRLIVSSYQVAAEGHGYERWGLLPLERRRLYDLIFTTGANGVVILSGDRHLGAIYRDETAPAYPLYEVTSSSLNAPSWSWAQGEREPGPKRIADTYGDVNFGLIQFDWEADALGLELRGGDGALQRGVMVRLSDLRASVN